MRSRLFYLVSGPFLLAFTSSLCAQDLPVMDGLQLWLDATDASTVFSDPFLEDLAVDGGPVNSWLDKSENAWEVFNDGDEILAPSYNTSAINGLPAVRFSGSDGDGLLIDDFFELSRPYTVFIVNQYWGDIRGRTLQSNTINWLHGLWAGNVSSYAEGFIGDNPRAIKEFPYVADTTGTDAGSTFFVNGVDLTVNSSPTGVPGTLALGTAGQFNEPSDADISEVIVYDRVLDNTELGTMRTFLYEKYQTEEFRLPEPVVKEVFFGEVATFSGADPGEGLDFEGEFAHAVNVGGPGALLVGDVEFTDGSEDLFDSPGVNITDANEILNWHEPNYGDSLDDDELEIAMQSIRWNTPPGMELDLEVEEGQSYKLQLMFAESCCNRGFDIFIEDELAVDNINIQEEQGGINNQATGVLFTHSFTATDDELNILLGGANEGAPDNNPIINAITLELIENLAILGDCNEDGSLDAADLACVGTIEERDAVLSALNTLPGDLDGNGEVAFADFLVLSANFGQSLSGYTVGNIDLAGDIDFGDFLILSANFGQTAAVAAVPEPSSVALAACLSLGVVAGLRRRLA